MLARERAYTRRGARRRPMLVARAIDTLSMEDPSSGCSPPFTRQSRETLRARARAMQILITSAARAHLSDKHGLNNEAPRVELANIYRVVEREGEDSFLTEGCFINCDSVYINREVELIGEGNRVSRRDQCSIKLGEQDEIIGMRNARPGHAI